MAKLYEMIKDSFSWYSSKCYQYFQHVKAVLFNASVLYFPDYSLLWDIWCDVSYDAVGSVLYQDFTDASCKLVRQQPIAFASKRFSGPASNWYTFKREARAIYHAVHSFGYYLRGKDFIIESDHMNLQWIEFSQSPKVVRLKPLLQSFTFFVRYIPERENKVADCMSRLYVPLPKLPTNLPTDLPFSDKQLTASLCLLTPTSFDQIMIAVHGRSCLHFGAYETWSRAKQLSPRMRFSESSPRLC